MTAEPNDRDLLFGALDRLHTTDAEYRGFLANHGPMAADAIVRLGGSSNLAAWIDDYITELEPSTPPRHHIDDLQWEAHLGDASMIGNWRDHFETDIARQGWHETLTTWWPRLLPGAAASATHGLIRTAHAARNLDEHGDHATLRTELACGLALWAARFERLPAATPRRSGIDLRHAIAQLPRLDPGVPSDGPGVGGRLRALGRLPGFDTALGAWTPPSDVNTGFDQLIGSAARIVEAVGNDPIALCHALTAPAAARMILPVLPDAQHRETLATSWQLAGSIIAVYVQNHHEAQDNRRGSSEALDVADPTDSASLAEAALAHGDEHVIKLTEACVREYEITHDDVLLTAATAFRTRVAPRRSSPSQRSCDR